MHTNTLYQERFEHDACGIGAVVSIDGTKSHRVVSDALEIVEKLLIEVKDDESSNRKRNS